MTVLIAYATCQGAEFVRQHGSALHGRPIWLFSLSTVGDEESMFRPAIAHRMRMMRKETKELAEFRRMLEPIEHRNFAGAIAPSHWPPTGRAFFRAVGGRYGDHRNWEAIDKWGDQIVAYLSTFSREGERRGLQSSEAAQQREVEREVVGQPGAS